MCAVVAVSPVPILSQGKCFFLSGNMSFLKPGDDSKKDLDLKYHFDAQAVAAGTNFAFPAYIGAAAELDNTVEEWRSIIRPAAAEFLGCLFFMFIVLGSAMNTSVEKNFKQPVLLLTERLRSFMYGPMSSPLAFVFAAFSVPYSSSDLYT